MLRMARAGPALGRIAGAACRPLAPVRLVAQVRCQSGAMSPEAMQRIKNWTQAMVAAPPRKIHTTIDVTHANLYGATMAFTEKEPWLTFDEGSALPPLWHLAYFVEPKPTFGLSADGHAKDIKPPAPFDTGARMFAGATITFNTSNPLRCGDKAVVEMYYPAEGVRIKEGQKRGPLVFVEEVRDFWNQTGLCLTERRNVVYMTLPTKPKDPGPAVDAKPAAAPPSQPAADDMPKPDWEKKVTPDTALLFRYSALTFNTHKIHYERTHTKEVEKHRDLVVHGPLVAQFLSDELRNVLGPEKSKGIASYKFRLNSPYYVDRAITLRGALGKNASGEEEWTVWAVDADGRSGVKGVVTLEAS